MSTPPSLALLDEIVLGPARGRAPARLELGPVRELTEADLVRLAASPHKGVTAPAVAKLRNTHHTLARLLADGVAPGKASLITGYSLSRISILQADPSFRELLEHYTAVKAEVYLDVHQRVGALALSMVDELQERLETVPETFTNKELREAATAMLDRSYTRGAAPGAGGPSVPSITINFKSPPPATSPQPEPNSHGHMSPEPGEFGQPEPITDLEIDAEIP
jgi:hypothetical protein